MQRGKRPEREATDDSLGDERDKTDQQLARRRATVETAADSVVAVARRGADEVLSNARQAADDGRDAAPSVEVERRRADGVLQQERRTEDDTTDREREEHQRILNELLQAEREQTDSQLVAERRGGDAREAAYGSFFGMVSHDLRGMLHSISMAATLIGIDAPGEDARERNIRERVGMIQRTGIRMNRLVGDLLDVAAIESGNLRVVPKTGDARDVLREFEVLFRPTATASKLSLTVALPEEPVPAAFDHDRLLQVFGNLASNAVKFTPAGGQIALRMETLSSDIRCSVSDTGKGIAQQNLAAIFERFWQVQRDRRGVGLGLYICKCIVEAHGGRIWATSLPGTGSTFFFTLPRL
jgi:signal transduction histidine kinase